MDNRKRAAITAAEKEKQQLTTTTTSRIATPTAPRAGTTTSQQPTTTKIVGSKTTLQGNRQESSKNRFGNSSTITQNIQNVNSSKIDSKEEQNNNDETTLEQLVKLWGYLSKNYIDILKGDFKNEYFENEIRGDFLEKIKEGYDVSNLRKACLEFDGKNEPKNENISSYIKSLNILISELEDEKVKESIKRSFQLSNDNSNERKELLARLSEKLSKLNLEVEEKLGVEKELDRLDRLEDGNKLLSITFGNEDKKNDFDSDGFSLEEIKFDFKEMSDANRISVAQLREQFKTQGRKLFLKLNREESLRNEIKDLKEQINEISKYQRDSFRESLSEFENGKNSEIKKAIDNTALKYSGLLELEAKRRKFSNLLNAKLWEYIFKIIGFNKREYRLQPENYFKEVNRKLEECGLSCIDGKDFKNIFELSIERLENIKSIKNSESENRNLNSSISEYSSSNKESVIANSRQIESAHKTITELQLKLRNTENELKSLKQSFEELNSKISENSNVLKNDEDSDNELDENINSNELNLELDNIFSESDESEEDSQDENKDQQRNTEVVTT
ncbi:MAG TPA: hypothetical protein VN854_00030 [Mycoplasmatales bacterium]|nr:hypothetical protein [Mycoplasmatales bacterium]